MRHILGLSLSALLGGSIFAIVEFGYPVQPAIGQSTPAITVSSSVPGELNPPFTSGPPSTGGAPAATPAQAAAFAWQEFIALNWPAGPQAGPARSARHAISRPAISANRIARGPTVWQTFRSKVEIFPRSAYRRSCRRPAIRARTATNRSAMTRSAVYNYSTSRCAACDQRQAGDPVPWINLDETDQITSTTCMPAYVQADSSPGNSVAAADPLPGQGQPVEYVYVTKNSSRPTRRTSGGSRFRPRGDGHEGLSGPKPGEPAGRTIRPW